MKKIININFHGRVVPIEETAYDILKQYIESLRKHFANEEGRDEIINDIENRFAELFSERLQKGSTCITDDDVNVIIKSMGRPEDLEKEDMSQNSNTGETTNGGTKQGFSQQQYVTDEPRNLYRSENDKILGGVCAGLAAYLRLDPSIVRIIYALIILGSFGFGFLLYIILWIVLPPKSLAATVRKRLYRNPDSRVIAGVASGMAAYFNIQVWVPRLIFALPLILGIITSIFRNAWFDFDPGPVFFTGGFGGTLFIIYIILWIVLPEATTASEKLEMRGEKVDIESIKNTIKSDLEGFKYRARDVGVEMRDRAQEFTRDVRQATQHFASEAAPVARRTGSGIGHVIGVLFKAFFLFFAGILAFALIMFLIGLLFSGAGAFPFRNYLLTGPWQNFLAWTSLVLFLCIPVVALLTWLIRRIMGIRSRNNYLGYAFGSLWVMGLISFIIFISMLLNNFRTKASVDEEITLNQPASGKIVISVAEEKVSYYGNDWFGFHWDNDAPFYSLTEDSVIMNTVRVNIVKSKDSVYHVHRVRFSHGNNPVIAKDLANQIQFNVRQSDSILYLSQGFAITPHQKFRNQQVLIVVEIPVGKRVYIDRSVDDYHWFSININRRHRGWNIDWNDQWDDNYSWSSNVDYIMTNDGIERADKKISDSNEGDDENKNQQSENRYRYKKKTDSLKHKKTKDSLKQKSTATAAADQVTAKHKETLLLKKEEWKDVSGNKSLKDSESENSYSPFDILSKMM